MSRWWLVLGGSVLYGFVLLLARRWRLHQARRRGLPREHFVPFDHRALLDELEELYAAGLPPGPGGGGEPLESRVSDLGRPVGWLAPERWEPPSLTGVPDALARARDRIAGGHDAQVAELVEPGQPAEVDQHFASLGIHWFLRRLYRGDLDGAARLVGHLPEWTNGRVSRAVAEKHLGQLAYLRAETARREGDSRRWRLASEARRRLAAAGATSGFAEPGTVALWAHLRLGWFTHALNLEPALWLTERRLKRTLAEHRSSAVLFYELAHHAALAGHAEDAVDHLARALFYADGDPFYVRAVLSSPDVERIKPALVHQVRARFGGGKSAN